MENDDNAPPPPEPSPAAPDPRRTGGGSIAGTALRRKKRFFWLNVGVAAATLLIVAGSLFWLFAFSIYAVASNSMAPTLLSTPEERDHLLCWRLTYRYRSPKRWEIAIFDTPKSGADREFMPGLHTGGETGVTVKRIAGLAGERLAIAGGDIWTRPLGERGEYRRQVKPDSVQQGMWIPVYKEDFSDLSTDEFLLFWKSLTETPVAVRPDTGLAMPAGSAIRYLPKARVGSEGSRRMRVLPGIPDRYLLKQELFFTCEVCGSAFRVVLDTQKVVGRCPECRHLNPETAVSLYELRSGLPEIGKYHASDTLQGDSQHFRANSYQFVGDLRIVLDIRPATRAAAFRAELHGEERTASLTIGADTCLVNDRTLNLAMPALAPGEWTRVEFQVVDGAVRAFLGEKRKPFFDRVVWKGVKPDSHFDGWASGIVLMASGGDVEIRNLAVDRDVHYFSGRRQGMLNYLAAMDFDGELDIPPGHFFPLGDNTTVSLDGRSWGAVDMDLLMGTAIRIWRPEHRAGTIPAP